MSEQPEPHDAPSSAEVTEFIEVTEFTEPAETVDRCREALTLTSTRTMDDVALDYLTLYGARESTRREATSDLRRTGSGN